MQITRKHSSTSNVIRCKLRSSSTGQGLTGLTSSSSGLIISTICDNEESATTYTVAGSTIETITTLATYAAPTSTKCRFKEVDSTNHKGLYEFHFADARFSVANAKVLRVDITGASGLIDKEIVIQLDVVSSDLMQIGGSAQSATDLKDFADTGYDPVEHKTLAVLDTGGPTAVVIEEAISNDNDGIATQQGIADKVVSTLLNISNTPVEIIDSDVTEFSFGVPKPSPTPYVGHVERR